MGRIAVTVLALCLALAACGGGNQLVSIEEMEPAERAEFLAAASTGTVEAGSARVYYDLSFGELGDATGGGVFDLEEQIGHVTMDFGAIAAAAGAPAGTDASMEAVQVGNVTYMRMPFLAQVDPRIGDKWIRMDLDVLGGELGVDLGQLADASSNDPTQVLAFLEGASGDSVVEVGREEITLAGGEGPTVEAVHFTATVDLRAAYENAGAITDPQRFERFIDQLGTTELDVHGWVDDEDRVVRMTFAIAFPPEAGIGGQMEMTTDLYDFGVDVDVTEPAEGEYIDIQELMGAGAGAG